MKGIKLLLPLILAVSLSINAPIALAEENASTYDTQLKALEKRFFMHDFQRDSTDVRLSRMEKFTFGETHTGTPEARIAQLAKTLESHSPSQKLSDIMDLGSHAAVKKPNQLDAPAKSASTNDEDPSVEYPHVTYLEEQILGSTFAGQPLAKRLSRLETKAFGAPSRSDDLVDRTDALEEFAEKRLHKKAFAQRPEGSAGDDQGSVPRQIKLPPSVGSFLNTPRSAFHEAAAPSLNEDSVDPSITGSTPPPANARLLSRVAWCEMHTFGRTYPDLHLLPRLHQLNAKLFPSDHEKDIQLMDHFDNIVKEVVMRQHPAPNASSI